MVNNIYDEAISMLFGDFQIDHSYLLIEDKNIRYEIDKCFSRLIWKSRRRKRKIKRTLTFVIYENKKVTIKVHIEEIQKKIYLVGKNSLSGRNFKISTDYIYTEDPKIIKLSNLFSLFSR